MPQGQASLFEEGFSAVCPVNSALSKLHIPSKISSLSCTIRRCIAEGSCSWTCHSIKILLFHFLSSRLSGQIPTNYFPTVQSALVFLGTCDQHGQGLFFPPTDYLIEPGTLISWVHIRYDCLSNEQAVHGAGYAPVPVWTGTGNLARIGIRSPDRPARSQSL